jgi:hypothetical protein
MRRLQQAESSAIRFPKSQPKLSLRMVARTVHIQATEFVSRWSTGGQFNLRSALDLFSQVSHSCERGAFRFLFWWLFLHRRLRSSNEAQLASSCFAPFGGSFPKGYHSFLSEWLEKVSQPSLAEPFGSDSGVIESTAACLFSRSGVTTRLPSLCPSRRPQPSWQGGLYSCQCFRANFCVFYFFELLNSFLLVGPSRTKLSCLE